MADALRLLVLTPAETLLEVAEAAWVEMPLADGAPIGIRPGHAPLLAETATGPLRYADALGEHSRDLAAGILQIDRDGVTVLTSGGPQPSRASGADETHFKRLMEALLAVMRDPPEAPVGQEHEKRE